MANHITKTPKLRRGRTRMTIRMKPQLRDDLVAIAERRGEHLIDVVLQALTQYIKSDKRPSRRKQS